jgi:hypothetical protein
MNHLVIHGKTFDENADSENAKLTISTDFNDDDEQFYADLEIETFITKQKLALSINNLDNVIALHSYLEYILKANAINKQHIVK